MKRLNDFKNEILYYDCVHVLVNIIGNYYISIRKCQSLSTNWNQ